MICSKEKVDFIIKIQLLSNKLSIIIISIRSTNIGSIIKVDNF